MVCLICAREREQALKDGGLGHQLFKLWHQKQHVATSATCSFRTNADDKSIQLTARGQQALVGEPYWRDTPQTRFRAKEPREKWALCRNCIKIAERVLQPCIVMTPSCTSQARRSLHMGCLRTCPAPSRKPEKSGSSSNMHTLAH